MADRIVIGGGGLPPVGDPRRFGAVYRETRGHADRQRRRAAQLAREGVATSAGAAGVSVSVVAVTAASAGDGGDGGGGGGGALDISRSVLSQTTRANQVVPP